MEFLNEIRKYLDTILDEYSVELFDITYRKENRGYVLRVILDGDNVGIADLEVVSKRLKYWLDSEGVIPFDNYNIEVSTPGINRPLRNLKDYKKYIGYKSSIYLIKNNPYKRKFIKGKIINVDGNNILLKEKEKYYNIDYNMIKRANLDVDITFN
ncbi:MAG: ribosome maturation factor RimP [Deferribacterota bacterium]|nr:ribosome maturation factor RimP [Deferribacterota bacterium]